MNLVSRAVQQHRFVRYFFLFALIALAATILGGCGGSDDGGTTAVEVKLFPPTVTGCTQTDNPISSSDKIVTCYCNKNGSTGDVGFGVDYFMEMASGTKGPSENHEFYYTSTSGNCEYKLRTYLWKYDKAHISFYLLGPGIGKRSPSSPVYVYTVKP